MELIAYKVVLLLSVISCCIALG